MTEGEELNPERIWLQPECCVSPMEGRQWCQDNVWPTDSDCDATGVEYVRADLARTPTAAPSDEVVERVARAIYSEWWDWADCDGSIRSDDMKEVARAAIAALSAIEGEKK